MLDKTKEILGGILGFKGHFMHELSIEERQHSLSKFQLAYATIVISLRSLTLVKVIRRKGYPVGNNLAK